MIMFPVKLMSKAESFMRLLVPLVQKQGASFNLKTDGRLGIQSDGAHLLWYHAASRRVRTCVLPHLYAIGAGGPFDHVLLVASASALAGSAGVRTLARAGGRETTFGDSVGDGTAAAARCDGRHSIALRP